MMSLIFLKFSFFNRNEILFCHHKTIGIPEEGGIFLDEGGRGREMGRETLDTNSADYQG